MIARYSCTGDWRKTSVNTWVKYYITRTGIGVKGFTVFLVKVSDRAQLCGVTYFTTATQNCSILLRETTCIATLYVASCIWKSIRI